MLKRSIQLRMRLIKNAMWHTRRLWEKTLAQCLLSNEGIENCIMAQVPKNTAFILKPADPTQPKPNLTTQHHPGHWVNEELLQQYENTPHLKELAREMREAFARMGVPQSQQGKHTFQGVTGVWPESLKERMGKQGYTPSKGQAQKVQGDE